MCGITPKRRAKYARNSPQHIQKRRNRSSGNNQPKRIPRGLYHAITPEPTGAAAQSPAQSIQRRPIPTGAGTDRKTVPTESARNDCTKPEQLATVSQRRIFRGSPVRGVCSRFTAHLFVMPRKCFLRLSANFSAELHQITIMRNY